MSAINLPLLLAAALAGSPAFADATKDEASRQLAIKSGSFICQEESSGVAMPPNGVAISEADAKKLADWILSLPQ